MQQSATQAEKPKKSRNTGMPNGRPPKCTPELISTICRRVAAGESVRRICKDQSMPHRDTVLDWARSNPVFSAQYARAREDRADLIADEILEIADAATDANIARVQIEARKWSASKMYPRRYSDKLVHEGSEAEPIRVATKIEMVLVRPTREKE